MAFFPTLILLCSILLCRLKPQDVTTNVSQNDKILYLISLLMLWQVFYVIFWLLLDCLGKWQLPLHLWGYISQQKQNCLRVLCRNVLADKGLKLEKLQTPAYSALNSIHTTLCLKAMFTDANWEQRLWEKTSKRTFSNDITFLGLDRTIL